MTFYEKLQKQWETKGIKNLKNFSEVSGIPYTTMIRWRDIAPDSIKFEHIRFLSKFFGVSWDYWASDSEDSVVIVGEEKKLIERYRNASPDTKRAIDSILGLEKNSSEEHSSLKEA